MDINNPKMKKETQPPLTMHVDINVDEDCKKNIDRDTHRERASKRERDNV